MINCQKRCGFISVLGAPNAGKSTLINKLVGAKISIVSPKVQTTRTNVQGIIAVGQSQLIFCDTPGIMEPKKRLDRAMVSAAWASVSKSDLSMLIVDSKVGLDINTSSIIEKLTSNHKMPLLVLNKIDLVEKVKLLELTKAINNEGDFKKTYMVSAIHGDGLDALTRDISRSLPHSPWLFPPDQLSDMNSKSFAAEITRERIYHHLHQELPYSITVETEKWEQKVDGSIAIYQIVYVEHARQKAIVLGKGGSKIKRISMEVRKSLEESLQKKLHIMLLVKVRAKWREDPDYYKQWDLDFYA